MQRRHFLLSLTALPSLTHAASLAELQAEAARRRQQYLADLQQLARSTPAEIYNNPLDPSLGRPDARRTVLVFSDFNCPYCRKLDPVLATVARQNPALVRFVFIWLDTMADSSQLAATYALQVWQAQPERYPAVQTALLQGPLPLPEGDIRQVAQQTGTQPSLAKAAQAQSQLQKNSQLAKRLQVYATPTLLIGDRMMSGMTDAATLKAEIERWPLS